MEIGYLILDKNNAGDHRFNTIHDPQNQVPGRLTQWGHQNHGNAVIWRDKAADVNIPHRGNLAAKDAVVQHLQGDAATAAEKYVRRVPAQVWTAIPASIAKHFNWMPGPTDGMITTADDLRFKDWQECRTTTGRLDGTLEKLRKVGFSLITGLLTAGSFLNFL